MIKKNKQKTVFLTGATGLVGSYLLKVLLQNGYKVYVLARGKDNKSARDRVIDILKFWDKDILAKHTSHIHGAKEHENVIPAKAGIQRKTESWIPCQARNDRGGVFSGQKSHNLVVLEGDITKKKLGLNKKTIDLLKNEVEEIFHSAAATQFNWPLEKIRKVNVEGTKNVLDLAIKWGEKGKLKKVNHLSTAYICGDYNGVFKECDLNVGQRFNSTYEQSKFEAEKLVEEYRKKRLWVDIFRPSLIVGESETGKTFIFQQSVYQLLHIWNLEIFDYFPGKGFFINIVFVDDICKAVFKISSQTNLKNRNYHPFSSEAVPLETILDISSKFLGFTKPKMVSRDNFLKNNPTPAQKMLLQNNIHMFNSNVRLSSEITNKLLKEYGFEFSDFNRDSFLKLLEYCVEEGFLKRRLR